MSTGISSKNYSTNDDNQRLDWGLGSEQNLGILTCILDLQEIVGCLSIIFILLI